MSQKSAANPAPVDEDKIPQAARRATVNGPRSRAIQEHKLDEALDDSFPASDPLPASPGSD